MHKEKYSTTNDVFTDIVIGMSDGLTVPFALAAGLSGAVAANSIIITAVSIVIAGGAIVMGVGGYFAAKPVRTDIEGEKIAAHEKEETKEFLANIGLSEEMQRKATEEIDKDNKLWADLIKNYELAPDKPDPARATKSALNIGLSYAIGGLVPLSPYFFADAPIDGLKISAAATLLCLFIFGFFKSKITGVNPWQGALRVTLISALAAGGAFGVAKLFEV
ncbi:MAG: VIT1/CCC1 transporter family protein [Chitinophagaceae bacterium]